MSSNHNLSTKLHAIIQLKHLFLASAIVIVSLVGSSLYFSIPTHVSGTPAPTPPADKCQLTQLAFCDTFQNSFNGGRGGQLNPATWSFSRITSSTNPYQQQVDNYYPAIAAVCGTQKLVQPDKDSFICGPSFGQPSHWAETINDGGIYNGGIRLGSGTHPEYYEGNVMVNSGRVLQPFDFASRTGNIVFDVDAQLDISGNDSSHGWWPEVWLTDQPTQAPHIDAAHVYNYPQNAIGFILNTCGGATVGSNLSFINEIVVINNFVPTKITPSPQSCFATKDQTANHFQIVISQSHVDFWASDAGGSNFRKVASTIVSLNFSRGYLSFEHADYNAAKYGYGNTSTLNWHAIGFDGPTIQADKVSQIPDALQVITTIQAQQGGVTAGTVNLGYQLGVCNSFTCPSPPGTPGSSPTFSLTNVDLSNIQKAYITYNVSFDAAPHQITANINGTSTTFVDPNTYCSDPIGSNCFSGDWRSIVQPIPLSLLHNGTNTVSFTDPGSAGQNPVIANVDLELVPN